MKTEKPLKADKGPDGGEDGEEGLVRRMTPEPGHQGGDETGQSLAEADVSPVLHKVSQFHCILHLQS